jgi:hypothetical protein
MEEARIKMVGDASWNRENTISAIARYGTFMYEYVCIREYVCMCVLTSFLIFHYFNYGIYIYID